MDIFMPMATTDRHNKFVATLMNRIFNRVESGEVHALQEQCPLVYWGSKDLPKGFELVDVSDIKNTEHFLDNITELEYVNPDFMLFADNPYIKNKKGTRTAGQPDLIVEIWSDSNTDNNRAFLQNLYASSPITEHWYIEQNSNDVTCYMGKERLADQFLTNVLVTQNGIKFDLRYLAI
ncbi:MAG: Uma2 family endonuclease [Oscillospiraceae bacterium]|nr:Uma2 family endonuclease [Oscillospiraceae bacterium]